MNEKVVFLVKAHSWDYDFHDDVQAVFTTMDEAVKFAGPGYDRRNQTGMVVEEWTIGPNGRDDKKIVYPPDVLG
jgi:hypothetical protein